MIFLEPYFFLKLCHFVISQLFTCTVFRLIAVAFIGLVRCCILPGGFDSYTSQARYPFDFKTLFLYQVKPVFTGFSQGQAERILNILP